MNLWPKYNHFLNIGGAVVLSLIFIGIILLIERW